MRGCVPRRELGDRPDTGARAAILEVRVEFGRSRPAASIVDEQPSNRIADKSARLYRPATLVALRRGLETYETAALPLSYVGAVQEEPIAQRHPLFVLMQTLSRSCL